MDFLISGLLSITWQQWTMYVVGAVLIYLALKKGFEPSLLMPMGFGAILVNLPASGVINQTLEGIGETNGIIEWLFNVGIEASEALPRASWYFWLPSKTPAVCCTTWTMASTMSWFCSETAFTLASLADCASKNSLMSMGIKVVINVPMSATIAVVTGVQSMLLISFLPCPQSGTGTRRDVPPSAVWCSRQGWRASEDRSSPPAPSPSQTPPSNPAEGGSHL